MKRNEGETVEEEEKEEGRTTHQASLFTFFPRLLLYHKGCSSLGSGCVNTNTLVVNKETITICK